MKSNLCTQHKFILSIYKNTNMDAFRLKLKGDNVMEELEKKAKEKALAVWLIMSFDDFNNTEKQIVLGLDTKDYDNGKTKIFLYDSLNEFYIQLMESYQNEAPENMFETTNEDDVDDTITIYNTFYVIELKNEERYIFSKDNYKDFNMNILFGIDDKCVKSIYDVSYEFKTKRR